MAFGAPKYIEQAVHLARSLVRNFPSAQRAVVTDSDDPRLRRLFDHVVPLRADWGSGVDQKLRLPDYTPFAETLFIDSDCLVVRDIDFLWEMLGVVPVGVISGLNQLEGRWLGADIAEVRRRAGVDAPLPNFNGGIVYFASDPLVQDIYSAAREFLSRYSELGFAAVKGRSWTASEEPALGLALAQRGVRAVNDHGRGMRTTIGARGLTKVDVMTGESAVRKAEFVASPAVVHFAHKATGGLLYRRETAKLAALAGERSTWWFGVADGATDLALAVHARSSKPLDRAARAALKKLLGRR